MLLYSDTVMLIRKENVFKLYFNKSMSKNIGCFGMNTYQEQMMTAWPSHD